jgi:hypothetical protein
MGKSWRFGLSVNRRCGDITFEGGSSHSRSRVASGPRRDYRRWMRLSIDRVALAISLLVLAGCGSGTSSSGTGGSGGNPAGGRGGTGGATGAAGSVGAGGSGGPGGSAGAGGAAGGAGAGGACAEFTACGGSLLGTWQLTSTCFFMPPAASGCADETVDAATFHESGSYVFNSDLTYAASLIPSGTLGFSMPQSCTPAQPIATTCAVFNATYSSLVSQPGSPYASAGCAVSGTDCVCTFTFNGQTISATGTYAVGTDTVTLTRAGSTTSTTNNFCVQGTALSLDAVSLTGTAVVGPAMLTKQP